MFNKIKNDIYLLKRVKCALLHDVPFEYVEGFKDDTYEGVYRRVTCPKCGLIYSVFNKKKEEWNRNK